MKKKSPDFYEIYEYEHISFWRSPEGKLSVAAIGGMVIAFILGAVYLIMRRKRLARLHVTPWQAALSELERLERQTPGSKNEIKQFYFSLTTLLKRYLSQRFLWSIENKTDEELIRFLKKASFDPELCQNLEKLLVSVVEIKFADVQTVKERVEKDLILARHLVTKTIPHNEN